MLSLSIKKLENCSKERLVLNCRELELILKRIQGFPLFLRRVQSLEELGKLVLMCDKKTKTWSCHTHKSLQNQY